MPVFTWFGSHHKAGGSGPGVLTSVVVATSVADNNGLRCDSSLTTSTNMPVCLDARHGPAARLAVNFDHASIELYRRSKR